MVLCNILRTYDIKDIYRDKDNPWSGILADIYLSVFSTINRLRIYSPGQVVFGRDLITPITHTAYL